MMRCGLFPFFAKGIPPKYSTINATIEKLADGPTWRGPWKRAQRCILPAAGFYEWHVNDESAWSAWTTPFVWHCRSTTGLRQQLGENAGCA
jgi:putative SOS response-associated peptidase YedK